MNWASVGELSDPLHPPTAITALPVASSSSAADWSPTTAAAHFDVVAFSFAVRAALVVTVPPVAPVPEPAPVVGRVPLKSVPLGRLPSIAAPFFIPEGMEPLPPGVPLLLVCAAVGPTLGIEPVCALAAVATPKAPMPSNAETRPSVTALRAASRNGTNRAITESTVAASTIQRSSGYHEDVRLSSTNDQPPAATTIAASPTRPTTVERSRHRAAPPTATSAASDGASATV